MVAGLSQIQVNASTLLSLMEHLHINIIAKWSL